MIPANSAEVPPQAEVGCLARIINGVFGLGCLSFLYIIFAPVLGYQACRTSSTVPAQKGDLSKRGGSATVRKEFDRKPDGTLTTNDESNDQPVGHFGTLTLSVYSQEAGHYYTLDGDLDGFTLERLYFPRGGWVDFYYCDLEEDYTGECEDEQGRTWVIAGES